MMPAAPAPAASPRSETLITVPRVAEADWGATLTAATWPPVPGAALPLRQAWRPQPEAAFHPGVVWVSATRDALLLCAELQGSGNRTAATRDHDLLCDRGDVFEIFLQAFGGEIYHEFQIAPNGHLLQLEYPYAGASRREGIDRYIRRERRIAFDQRHDAGSGIWRVVVRLPVVSLLPPSTRANGAEWRFACCRYDYAPDGSFCLSSTAALTRPDFHRIGEWSRLSVSGGLSPPFGARS